MMKEFALKSGIRGFSYAQTDNKLERMMWYTIIIVCTGLTAYDVIITLENYVSFPTSTKVTFYDNTSLSFGSPSLCIPISNYLDDFQLIETAEEAKSLLDKFSHQLRVETLTNNFLFDTTNDTQVIPLRLIMAVISSVTRAEHRLSNNNGEYGWGFVQNIGSAGNWSLKIGGKLQVQATAEWLKSSKISINQAAKSITNLLCHILNIRLQKGDHNYEEGLCENIEATWIGTLPSFHSYHEEFLCYKFPSKHFNLTSPSDLVVIHFEMARFLLGVQRLSSFFALDFSGTSSPFFGGRNICFQKIADTSMVKLAVLSQFERLSKANQPCSKDVIQSECQFQCRNDYIKKWCNCQPIPFSAANDSDLSDCSLESLATDKVDKCGEIHRKQFPDKNCVLKCHPKCSGFILAFGYWVSYDDPIPNVTSLTVVAEPYSYTYFEEISLIGPKQIMASLGGNLSLYLGVNFMLLYYSVFFWISALVKKTVKFQ